MFYNQDCHGVSGRTTQRAAETHTAPAPRSRGPDTAAHGTVVPEPPRKTQDCRTLSGPMLLLSGKRQSKRGSGSVGGEPMHPCLPWQQRPPSTCRAQLLETETGKGVGLCSW